MRTLSLALVLLAAAIIAGGAATWRQVEAQQALEEVTSVCVQIPGLLAAIDHTERIAPSGDYQAWALVRYLRRSLTEDLGWCREFGAAGNQYHTLLAQTMRWHFGVASEELRRIQGSIPTGGGADRAPSPAAPTATPTLMPVVVVPTATTAPQQPTATPTPAPLRIEPLSVGSHIPELPHCSAGFPPTRAWQNIWAGAYYEGSGTAGILGYHTPPNGYRRLWKNTSTELTGPHGCLAYNLGTYLAAGEYEISVSWGGYGWANVRKAKFTIVE